jgi:hypothetical protein
MLLGSIAAALILIVPIFGGQAADGNIREFAIRERLVIMFLVVLATILPFINIFFFNNNVSKNVI